MDTEELEELYKRAKPLLELLKEKCNMHTSVIVSIDKIKIVNDEIGYPLNVVRGEKKEYENRINC